MTIQHDLDDGDPRIRTSIVASIFMVILALGITALSIWVGYVSKNQTDIMQRVTITETNQRMVIQTLPKIDDALNNLNKSTEALGRQLAIHEVTTQKMFTGAGKKLDEIRR
jgi:uncharacterized protein YoxC